METKPDYQVLDRLARAEQNIINHEKNFHTFKSDDFGALKREVHSMRGELNVKIDAQNDKIDTLLEKVSAINLLMAKWIGGAAALLFIGRLFFEKFF